MFYKTILAAAGMALVLAPTAQADQQSFVDYVNANGLQQWTAPGDQGTITAGWQVCAVMNSGATPEQVAQMSPMNPTGAAFAAAAKQHLCP